MGERNKESFEALPPLDDLSYPQAKRLQEEWGGLVVRNPDTPTKCWCWVMDPKQELPILRPELATIPLSVWAMAGFDEKRMEVWVGYDPDRPN
jgi:hypothetical protein